MRSMSRRAWRRSSSSAPNISSWASGAAAGVGVALAAWPPVGTGRPAAHALGDSAPSAVASHATLAEGMRPARERRRRRLRFIVLPKLQMQIVGTQLAGAIFFALILVAAIIGPEVATVLSSEEGPAFGSCS